LSLHKIRLFTRISVLTLSQDSIVTAQRYLLQIDHKIESNLIISCEGGFPRYT